MKVMAKGKLLPALRVMLPPCVGVLDCVSLLVLPLLALLRGRSGRLLALLRFLPSLSAAQCRADLFSDIACARSAAGSYNAAAPSMQSFIRIEKHKPT